MTEVLKAKATLDRIKADLARATDNGTQLQVERRKISFSAHSGDAKSKARLDKLNAESLESGLRIENLISAADEAKARVATAEHEAGLAAQRANAKEAVSLATHASKRGARIRDLTQELAAEIAGGDQRPAALWHSGRTDERHKAARASVNAVHSAAAARSGDRLRPDSSRQPPSG